MAVRPVRWPLAGLGREDGGCCFCGGRRDGKKGLFAMYFRGRDTGLDDELDEDEKKSTIENNVYILSTNKFWVDNLLRYERLEAKQTVCGGGGWGWPEV